MMNERKLRILQAIIQNYIISAEPVGSRTLSKKYNLGISPATIRNEMSDLEELGFLVQPHTSAGRIPSDKAYRLYVDNILKTIDYSEVIRNEIKNDLEKEISEIENIIINSAKILSKFTNYTSIAIAPEIRESKLKHIQLVPVDESKILVVLVTDTGVVKNAIFRIDKEIPIDQLYIISKYLTDKLKGCNISKLENKIKNEIYNSKELFNKLELLIPILNKSLNEVKKIKHFTDGVTNIFNFPEYNDISKAKEFISFIENKSNIIDILTNNDFKDFSISIGSENCYDELKNCSLITATYKLNGHIIGKVGLIGPTRMQYSKVIPLIKIITKDVNDILSKYFIE